jgi:enamine deaminase RidA (YjgF/YER057c/UK114 family)
LVFVAGQGCRDSKTNSYAGVSFLPDGSVAHVDVAAQARGVLANVEAVLTSEGLSRADLVDVQVFLTDMNDFARMNDVWNSFFADVPCPPTRTTVAVAALPGLNRIEMKCIARSKDA